MTGFWLADTVLATLLNHFRANFGHFGGPNGRWMAGNAKKCNETGSEEVFGGKYTSNLDADPTGMTTLGIKDGALDDSGPRKQVQAVRDVRPSWV